MSDDKSRSYGTADPDAPVTRADFERALRFLNISDLDVRDNLLRLAAHVVALTDELTRRIDGVEPEPAKPDTPARKATGTVEQRVARTVNETYSKIKGAEVEARRDRVWLESDPEDKYAVPGPDIPCAELIPICQARCCTMNFPLSTTDLDEGVIRWDYGRPYMIRQRASDKYCVHNDPTSRGCTVHASRPLVCRKYDCRDDTRIWTDFDKRILAPLEVSTDTQAPFDIMTRMRQREYAFITESYALGDVYPEGDARVGPTPPPGQRMHPKR